MISSRQLAVLLSSALLAGGLTAVAVPSAGAADAPPPLVIAGDHDADGDVDLYTRAATGGAPLKVLFDGWMYESPSNVTTSPDGSRVAYLVEEYNTPTQRLVVADVAGRFERTVLTVDWDSNDIGRPSFSPDGSSLAFTLYSESATSASQVVKKVAVASGSPTTVPGSQGAYTVAWTSASEMLVVSMMGELLRLPASGTTATLAKVSGAPPAAQLISVISSPVPGQVGFWLYDRMTGSAYISTAQYAAGALTTLTQVTSGHRDGLPSFSLDGSTVFFTRCSPCDEEDFSNVWHVPANGSGPATMSFDTLGPEDGVAPIAAPDTTVPGPVTLGTASLSGVSARIKVDPVESDLSGVLVTRRIAGGAIQKTDQYAVVSGGYFTDTGLVVGTTYEYTVKPIDRSDNIGPASAAKLLTATEAPRFTISDPTSKTQVRAPFPVALTTANKAGTRYTIDYRNMAGTTFARWQTDTTAKAFSGTTAFGAGNVPAAVTPGAVYQFRASAKDAYGNTTAAAVSTAKAIVPFDQTKAVISTAATTSTGADRWMGSVRNLGAAGQKATLTVVGDRFQVIGERNTNGGRFDVYVKNSSGVFAKLTGTPINTYATARSARQVLYTFTASTVASRTFEIRWVTGSSSTRNKVVLDGFAVRR